MTCPTTVWVEGRAKGQQVVDPCPHFFQPGVDLWVFLPSLSALFGCDRADLHINFLILGGCLIAAIGGSANGKNFT